MSTRTKVVLVSQRVDVVPERGERRDSLDQRIPAMLASCGIRAVPVPNLPSQVAELWDAQRPHGVVLSGGNDLIGYGGNSPERDYTERALLDQAVRHGTPVLGICRGMQLITTYFGGQLERVADHAGTRHEVRGRWGAFTTNSYHQLAPALLPLSLRDTMRAADGCVEAVQHLALPVLGIMWHPERETTLAEHDRYLIESLFQTVTVTKVAVSQ